jgi:hypothetical protein
MNHGKAKATRENYPQMPCSWPGRSTLVTLPFCYFMGSCLQAERSRQSQAMKPRVSSVLRLSRNSAEAVKPGNIDE